MTEGDLRQQLTEARKTIRELHKELADSNKGMLALTLELEQREERFRAIFENAGEAIITFDLADVIQSWNRAAEEMFGYTAKEMVGRTFYAIVPEVLWEKGELVQLREIMQETGKVVRHETQRLRKDGTGIEVVLTRSALKDKEGNMTGFIALLTDITQRKLAQEKLAQQAESLARANSELAAVNKELESFSYSVSHDLRAPLRGIDGFSHALLEDYSDKLDEQGKEYLQRVRSATQRMGELIDDMLTLSRVTRNEMRRETIDLSTLAKTVIAELQKTQPERQVEFVIAEGLTTNGDTMLLRAVLENLLGNAWKFTGKQPKARIEFGVTQHEGKPAYYVRDDGVGFDMTYAGKLFAPFQRLHSAGEFPGTGIGLATVQRIILRHGGKVWAEGAVGKGATFYFTLN